MQRYEWVYGTRASAEYEPSASEHRKIIGAIEKGDAVAARKALVSHWKNAAKRTIAVIEAIPSKPVRRAPAISQKLNASRPRLR